ncbi:MAG: hydroxyacylglutathione hydrolase, partial [Rickettsiales bacterium]|nr:hydroxyacylglutathione hydrolase [Rickettsiales bacterium]
FRLGESECKVLDVPGHTLGHIAYYFKDDNLLFCGDTLFSLGCGRLFEGTPDDMIKSLLKIRALPDKTQIFCGHEYTLANAMFAQNLEPENRSLKIKIEEIKKNKHLNKPTIPSLLGEEKKLNPFLRFDEIDFLEKIGIKNESITESFRTLRQMKDEF